MNLTLLNNCHQNEKIVSCLAEFGKVQNWSECEKICNQLFFFGKLRWDFQQM